MKEFDLELVKKHWAETKKYGFLQTRHGESVKLTCYDELLGERPIVGIVKYSSGETVVTWRSDGHYSPIHNEDPNDLVMKSVKKEAWVNVFRRNGYLVTSRVFESRDEALEDKNVTLDYYVTTARIEWEE